MAAPTARPAVGNRELWLNAVAPAVFVFLWSTGFVGARLALPFVEPATFLTARFGVASALLALLGLGLRQPWPRGRRLLHAAVAGLLLQAAYIGGVFFAIHHGLSSGITAMITSLQPVLTAMVAGAVVGERVGVVQWAGLTLGFAGVVMVLAEKAVGGIASLAPLGVGLAFTALLAGTAGTLYQKRFGGGTNLITGAAVQFAAAAVAMLLVSLPFESHRIVPDPRLGLAFVWLTLFNSLGAITILLYLIRRNTTSQVTALFYLVPPATALEAFLLFNERLGGLAMVGMLVTVVGVGIVVVRQRA